MPHLAHRYDLGKPSRGRRFRFVSPLLEASCDRRLAGCPNASHLRVYQPNPTSSSRPLHSRSILPATAWLPQPAERPLLVSGGVVRTASREHGVPGDGQRSPGGVCGGRDMAFCVQRSTDAMEVREQSGYDTAKTGSSKECSARGGQTSATGEACYA